MLVFTDTSFSTDNVAEQFLSFECKNLSIENFLLDTAQEIAIQKNVHCHLLQVRPWRTIRHQELKALLLFSQHFIAGG
jgi:hypothetical protein